MSIVKDALPADVLMLSERRASVPVMAPQLAISGVDGSNALMLVLVEED